MTWEDWYNTLKFLHTHGSILNGLPLSKLIKESREKVLKEEDKVNFVLHEALLDGRMKFVLAYKVIYNAHIDEALRAYTRMTFSSRKGN